MSHHLQKKYRAYKRWLFDCDGVLLDSNSAKTEAFRTVSRPYGEEVSERFIKYHQEHGGISRFHKFEHLYQNILGRPPEKGELDSVLDAFQAAVKTQLLKCREAPHLREVLALTGAQADLYVISGGQQDELREVFRERKLDHFFTAIYGSPNTKDDILARLESDGALSLPTLFVGDSRYDYEVASRYGLDFVFASTWSEFATWRNFFADKDIPVIDDIADMLS